MNTIRRQRKWRKSSRSGDSSTCIEVSNDLAALRDSKRPGPILELDVATFVKWAMSI